MSSLTGVVVAGAAVGTGAWMVWSGWSPARPPLAQTLSRLGQPVVAIAAERNNLDVRVGVWARRLPVIERVVSSMRTDLRVLRRSPDEQAALVVVYVVCGLLWAPVVAAGGWAVGIHLPVGIPLWLAVVGGAIGGAASVRPVRAQATEQRRMFSHALSSFCDVCGMCLAAGRGIDASIQTAASAGDGWPFAELQGTLRTGYVQGEAPWEALTRLAAECDLPDLTELAAALSLAGDEGAAVRDTVASKAKSIRERLTGNAERDAATVTERMGIPATLLLLGFIIFLGFPALYVLFQ
jgi:tight adherence protein C